jgi:hypothetical protein
VNRPRAVHRQDDAVPDQDAARVRDHASSMADALRSPVHVDVLSVRLDVVRLLPTATPPTSTAAS